MLPVTSETPCYNTFAPAQKQKTSLSMEGTSTDRVSLIRESLHHCNFSDNVEELTLQSWRASTQVKYKPVLGKWYNFCTE